MHLYTASAVALLTPVDLFCSDVLDLCIGGFCHRSITNYLSTHTVRFYVHMATTSAKSRLTCIMFILSMQLFWLSKSLVVKAYHRTARRDHVRQDASHSNNGLIGGREAVPKRRGSGGPPSSPSPRSHEPNQLPKTSPLRARLHIVWLGKPSDVPCHP